MRKSLRLLLVYLVVTIILMSIDVTYEWHSPFVPELEKPVEWYAEADLKAGALILSNHDTGPAMGFVINAHVPKVLPLPFFASAGPEGGGVLVADWLIAAIIFGLHILRFFRSERSSAL